MTSASIDGSKKAQSVSERKRVAILEAAVTEFCEQGYETTSMDRIALKADVSKRTVYNHFPSKEILFTETMGLLWEKSVSKLDLVYQSGKDIRPQLEELLWQKMRMLCNPQFIQLARVAMAEMIHSPERTCELVERLSKREEGITAWLRAAQADKRLVLNDVVFASHQLQALIKSFAFWPQVTLNQDILTEQVQTQVIQSALDMFLSAYAVH